MSIKVVISDILDLFIGPFVLQTNVIKYSQLDQLESFFITENLSVARSQILVMMSEPARELRLFLQFVMTVEFIIGDDNIRSAVASCRLDFYLVEAKGWGFWNLQSIPQAPLPFAVKYSLAGAIGQICILCSFLILHISVQFGI